MSALVRGETTSSARPCLAVNFECERMTDAHVDGPSHPGSFESALVELQQIAARLEDGSAGLETSLKDFARGVMLLRTCYRLLDDAELQIEQLVGFDAQGQPQTSPFDATATVPAKPAAGKKRATRPPSPDLGFGEL